MKQTTLSLIFALLTFAGCASTLKKSVVSDVWLDSYTLTDLHFSQVATLGTFEVSFLSTFSSGPVYKYVFARTTQPGSDKYKLYVYAALSAKDPEEQSLIYDPQTGLCRIVLSMPGFRRDKDSLVLVDGAGEHPIPYRDIEPPHLQALSFDEATKIAGAKLAELGIKVSPAPISMGRYKDADKVQSTAAREKVQDRTYFRLTYRELETGGTAIVYLDTITGEFLYCERIR